MNEPHWLNQEIILAIHTQLLARFGGLEGLRDEGLLESALARPNKLISDGAPSLSIWPLGKSMPTNSPRGSRPPASPPSPADYFLTFQGRPLPHCDQGFR